jgi:hypothetical protein
MASTNLAKAIRMKSLMWNWEEGGWDVGCGEKGEGRGGEQSVEGATHNAERAV